MDLRLTKTQPNFFWGLIALIGVITPFFLTQFLPLGLQNEQSLSRFIILKCPLNKFFDIYCPTCGLGRSLISLFLLNFEKSWSYHPGGIILYFSLSIVAFLYLLVPSFFLKLTNLMNKLIKDKLKNKVLTFLLVGFYVLWGVLREPF